jgi:hypothetical protein
VVLVRILTLADLQGKALPAKSLEYFDKYYPHGIILDPPELLKFCMPRRDTTLPYLLLSTAGAAEYALRYEELWSDASEALRPFVLGYINATAGYPDVNSDIFVKVRQEAAQEERQQSQPTWRKFDEQLRLLFLELWRKENP